MTLAAVEEGVRKLNKEDADDLRGQVCGIMRRDKLSKDNLTREQTMAMKQLKGWKDEVILPADKGNATVVMRREDYDRKMRELLDTTTYTRLKGDPTAVQENRLSHRLRELEKCEEITRAVQQT